MTKLLSFKPEFDTVYHNIHLNKLQHYGIRDVCLNLFFSFLTKKTSKYLYVSTISTSSGMKHSNCGVLKALFLGLLLFFYSFLIFCK